MRRRGQRRMKRGEIWFAATPGGDRPVLVLTRDPVTDRIGAVVVAALTRTEAWTGVGTEAAAGPRRGAYRLRGELRQPAYRPARRCAAESRSLPRRAWRKPAAASRPASASSSRFTGPACAASPAIPLTDSISASRYPDYPVLPGVGADLTVCRAQAAPPVPAALPHPTPALQREHAPQGRGTDRPVHARLRWDPRWRRSRRAL